MEVGNFPPASQYHYDEWGGLAAETFTAGSAIAGWEITTGLDQLGRLESLGVAVAGTGLDQFRILHRYDQAGRLASVSSGGATAYYDYDPVHQALRQTAISVNDTPVLYGNLQYDPYLQLRRISYHNGDLQGTLKTWSDFQYTRNDLGNITSITMADRSKQLVGYNAAGEVVKTEHLLDAAGTDRRRGANFAWTYDGIGNRLSAARGGDSAGANLRLATYTPDALNQYDTITHPGAVDVTGRAPLADTVTVNGDPVDRQGDRFHRTVSADNSGGPVWKQILVENGTDSHDGFTLIPPATRSPVHDADGNLTQDGVYQYGWDAENRLTRIETLAAAVSAGVPYRRVEYLYDSNWRRVQRLRHDQPASTTPVENTRYLWAGWRCLAEVDGNGQLAKTFVWGLDSRQSLHLGDGNGALLWINDLTLAQRHFCHYDGNGNITGLSDASGAQTAQYLYNAFGELLERSGTYADKNPYRFSTKPFEEVGGLYYYGYRYYDPATGRWPSRDPIREAGGLNLYAFDGNRVPNGIDTDGRKWKDIAEWLDWKLYEKITNYPKEKLKEEVVPYIAPSMNGPYLPRREVLKSKTVIGYCCACEKGGQVNFEGPVASCKSGWKYMSQMEEKTYVMRTGWYADDMTDQVIENSERTETDECPPVFLQ